MLKKIDYSTARRRDILCIDVRSFFASVEAVKHGLNPLTEKVIVLSNPHLDGGLVLAASPAVKEKYGIKTGSRKYELPDDKNLHIFEPRMALYVEINLRIQEIFRSFVMDQDIHPYSIDECFLDVTHSHGLFGSTREIAQKLSERIKNELGLIVAIGIGDNPLLSKLALDIEAKSNEESNFIAEWRYEDVEEKVWPIFPLTKMWGIGSRMARRLNQQTIHSVYDLAQADIDTLKAHYGVIGEQLFFHAHGVDESILSEKYIPRSTSYGKNQILDRDYTSQDEIEVVIREMAEENATRLRANHAMTALISLHIGFSKEVIEKGFSHQRTIPPTQSTRTLRKHFLSLFREYYTGEPVRTIMLSCGKITPHTCQQLTLFDSLEELREKEKLEKTIDFLRKKYGYTSILHASSLLKGSTVKKRAKLLGGHKA